MRIPWVRITSDGRVALLPDRPTFHSLAFGCGIVGVLRLALVHFEVQSGQVLAGAYVATIPTALLLGRVAAARMAERTPRVYTSGIAMIGMSLNMIPGSLPTAAGPSITNAMPIGAIAVLAAGEAFTELLNRAGRRGSSPSPVGRRAVGARGKGKP
jgi:hypothetical protein